MWVAYIVKVLAADHTAMIIENKLSLARHPNH